MAVLAVIDEKTNKVVNHIVAELTDKPPEGCYFVEIKDKNNKKIHTNVKLDAEWDGKKFKNPPEIIPEFNIEMVYRQCCPKES